ncbi:hypothetical protein CFS9_14270 [Flavobacterium sp. CFS9]|uniref:Uncharacterized protein n=1 Tax=Flavobacterium sp. CFS9 TaxID=3143118 RepID=A0AAT9GZV0_9FLAO
MVGGQLGQWASGALGGVVVNGIKVTSPLLQGTIIGSLSSGATGGVMSFGMALISGANFNSALNAAGQGLTTGLVTGAISGAGGAYANSVKNKVNPFNGNDLRTIDSEMVKVRHHTSVENMNKIRSSNQMTPSRYSGFSDYGVDFENTINFNGNQRIFDAKSTGAFIELIVPKSILTPSPNPQSPNHVRIMTGNKNLQITPEFRPKYYINIYFGNK